MVDNRYMRHAFVLARRALGQVAPNPAVGCVIVSREGRVVGCGWTVPGGRPHAETIALTRAGVAARGATAYVTLEPCAHHGETPPCAEALLQAGVARVVAVIEDPDPRVRGKGFNILRAGGVELTTGLLEREAADLNAGFFLRIQEDRPLVTLKLARSRDGMTVPPAAASRWITGEEARRFGHLLRAQHDAILVGIGTVLADDPELTCRLPGLHDRSPVRVVIDTQLRTPAVSKVVQSARVVPTLIFTATEGGDALRQHGAEVLRVVHDESGRPSLRAVLGVLAGRGCTRLLVEGGATVISAFLHEGYADRLEVFTAPVTLGAGADGQIAALSNLGGRFTRVGQRVLGPDLLETYAASA